MGGKFGRSIDPTIGGSITNPLGMGPGSYMSGSSGKNGTGKGGKAPAVPDLVGAANTEGAANLANTREQTQANRPDQYGPFGSSEWSQGPDGQWTQHTSLNGGLQQGADNLANQIGSQGPVGTGDQAREQAINSAYGQAASRLDPQWAQREEATRSQLANQGLDAGSQAYGNEMGNLGRERNDAYTSAMANAINQGTVAGHVAFGDNLAAANNPYQQLSQLQGLANPSQFVAAGRSAVPDLTGALSQQYGAQLNQYGQQQAGKNSQMAGLATLATLL